MNGNLVMWRTRRVFPLAAARSGLISDLREVYIDWLRHGIRFDFKLLQDSLARLGLPKL
jgi:hypothetical protein